MSLDELRQCNLAVITQTQAASVIGCDARTVNRGVQDKTIPSIKLGKRIYIPVAAFLRMLGYEA